MRVNPIVMKALFVCGAVALAGCTDTGSRGEPKREEDRAAFRMDAALKQRDDARSEISKLRSQLDDAEKKRIQLQVKLDDVTAELKKTREDLTTARTSVKPAPVEVAPVPVPAPAPAAIITPPPTSAPTTQPAPSTMP